MCKPGWWRSYKEFRAYAENAFHTDTFKEPPLRALVPFILQVYVDEERQKFVEDGEALLTHSRGWDGVYHSVLLRTEKRATLQRARLFVADWLSADREVLAFITETVENAPCYTYFA